MAMDFWKKHGEELRKGRLLQAAALILVHKSDGRDYDSVQVFRAVEKAMALERQIEFSLKKEKE